MKKSTFAVVLSVLASFVVFFYSVNVFYYERGREYMRFKLDEGHFGAVDNTCLVRATIIKHQFDKDNIPSRVLIFHCEKSVTERFSHAVTIYHSNGYLVIFDNDGSTLLGKLSDVNLDSDPKLVISKVYKFVTTATWMTIPE